MNEQERILIVRLSALGDVIHALPLLNALRDHLPGAHIAWLVEPLGAQVLRGHPSLSELIEVPRGWLKRPSLVWNLRKQLRAAGFTVSFDPQGLTKSALPAWFSGASRRIGFSGKDGRELSPWLNNSLIEPARTHVVERNLELLQTLGLPPVNEPRFDIPVQDETLARVDGFVHDNKLEQGFAVINPGAGWPSKRWSLTRYAEVANHLLEKHDLPTVVTWAGADENSWAAEIVSTTKEKAAMAPPTTIPELAALLLRARICIGSDTGPLHLAAALGRPAIGLFGPMPAERNGLYGPKCVNLQQMQVQGSSRERRTASTESMEAISIKQVCNACDELLGTVED